MCTFQRIWEKAKEMQLRYEQILVQAKNNLDFLETYKDKETTKIEQGSLIETEDLYIFIGISLQQFMLNGKNVIAISEDAPIYKSIKEKTIIAVIIRSLLTKDFIYANINPKTAAEKKNANLASFTNISDI